MFEADQELIADFVVESREGLAEIETDILRIEDCGSDLDTDLVNGVFRAIHSIKGASGFIGLTRIGELAHAFENALCLLRNGELVPSPASTDLFLRSADRLKQLIEDVNTSNEADVTDLVQALTDLAEGKTVVAADSVPAESEAPAPAASAPVDGDVLQQAVEASPGPEAFPFTVSDTDFTQHDARGHHLYAMTFELTNGLEAQARTPLELLQRLADTGEIVHSGVDLSGAGDLESPDPETFEFHVLLSTPLDPEIMQRFWGLPEDRMVPVTPSGGAQRHEARAAVDEPTVSDIETSNEPVEESEPNMQQDNSESEIHPSPGPAAESKPAVESNIRVSVSVLDRLMNLAGELVLARNQLLQTITTKDTRGLESVGAKLDQVTSEVQESIMPDSDAADRDRVQEVRTRCSRSEPATGKAVQFDRRGQGRGAGQDDYRGGQ